MSVLTDALHEHLRDQGGDVQMMLNSHVRSITSHQGGITASVMNHGGAPTLMEFDHVFSTCKKSLVPTVNMYGYIQLILQLYLVPANAAGTLLNEVPVAGRYLSSLQHANVAVVNLAYHSDVIPFNGYALICMICTKSCFLSHQ